MKSPRKLPVPLAALVLAVSPVMAIISDGAVHAEDATGDALDGAADHCEPGAPGADDCAEPAVPETPPVNAAPPVETTPVDTTPVDTTPVETAPVETAPVDTTPVDTAPVETAPVETTPVDTAPVETAPVETTPVETMPVETAPVETTPVDTTPVDTAPVDTAPVDTTPVDTAPVETTPVETTPVETAPVDTTPVETAPVDTAPVDTIPVDTTPAVVTPVEEPAEIPAESADRGDVTVEFDRGAVMPLPVTNIPETDAAAIDAGAADAAIVSPADTTDGPVEPDVRPNLSASNYDGVYADGVPVGVALSATRWLESRGDYNAQSPGSTASGAYQVIDSTWNGFGGYARAVDAPPAIQDQFAYDNFVEILKRHGNDVSKIPITWFYPKALNNPELMDQIPALWAGNVFTVREYQTVWMEKFYELLGEGAPVFLPADVDPLIPSIAFPVLGPVSFVNDWHYTRAGGARVHEGLDLLGSYNQPLRAAFNGEVVRLVRNNNGISGVSIEIRREDGTRAIYRHVNNDTPGTTDDSAIQAFRIHTGIDVGSFVRAGQIIGFMGDTGNAQGLPHLHFELRTDDRTPFAPYPAMLQAQQREQCSVGIGPWSTQFQSPTEQADAFDALLALTPEWVALLTVEDLQHLSAGQLDQLDGIAPETRAAIDAIVAPVPFEVSGPDGALWQIGADGTVLANGIGSLIAPTQGDCTVIPDEFTWYGTDAAGLSIDLLPFGWWGDEVPEAPAQLNPRQADALVARLADEDASFDSHLHDDEQPGEHSDDAEPIAFAFAAADTVSAGFFAAR